MIGQLELSIIKEKDVVMAKTINEHEGSKYIRRIYSCIDNSESIMIDVYSVIVAFNVSCPARQHAIKKLLCAGIRGKGSELEDLIGAEAAISRAIELQKNITFKEDGGKL